MTAVAVTDESAESPRSGVRWLAFAAALFAVSPVGGNRGGEHRRDHVPPLDEEKANGKARAELEAESE